MAHKSTSRVAIGLDIGSQYIRCVIGATAEDLPNPSILGYGQVKQRGVRKGMISDIDDASAAIGRAVEGASRMAGVAVNHASIGINGPHIVSINSHGVVAIGAGAREVTEQDVARVEEAATIMQLPPNREIIQAYTNNYQIDGAEGVSDPVGMSGTRMEADMALVTVLSPLLRNTERAVHGAGLEIRNKIANPLAASSSLLNQNQTDQGVVLIDIGATTTGVAVFEENQLLHVAVISIGSHHITQDIAIGLRTEIETAEEIKLKHVDIAKYPKSGGGARNFKIKDLKGDEITLSQREVNSIAKARAEEIFSLVGVELRKIKRDGLLPGGAILCGGGANLEGTVEVAKDTLRLPAQIGNFPKLGGNVESVKNPAFAAALGLMLEDLKLEQQPSYINLFSGWLKSAREIFSRYINIKRK